MSRSEDTQAERAEQVKRFHSEHFPKDLRNEFSARQIAAEVAPEHEQHDVVLDLVAGGLGPEFRLRCAGCTRIVFKWNIE